MMQFCQPLNRHRLQQRQTQAGFGLLEMLVSIAIALLMLLGISSVFFTQRFTYSSTTGLAQLQETERLATSLIANVAQPAGYYANPATVQRSTALPAISGVYAAGQFISGTDGGTASDTLRIRYQTNSGDNILNCLGNSNSTGGTVIYDNVFTVSTTNGKSVLNCQLADSSTGALTGTATPIIDGVQSIKVTYGYDPKATGSVTQYVPAGSVTDWTKVISINIVLTFVNPLYNAGGVNSTGQKATISMNQVIRLMNYSG